MSAPASRRRGFGPSARMKRSAEFALAKRLGQRLAVGCLVGNWRRTGEDFCSGSGSGPGSGSYSRSRSGSPSGSESGVGSGSGPRLGLVTSRKIGSAVMRNKARRLMRESFRLHRHELSGGYDLVLVARPSIAGKTFQQVERDFLALAGRAGLLKDGCGQNVQG